LNHREKRQIFSNTFKKIKM